MDKRILIVEDERDIRDFVVGNLKKRGFDVSECSSGNEGANLALQQRFDLIMLDWSLPGMEGIEICRKIREAKIHTPVLMLSAKDTEIDRVVGLEMGADDYLSKPFSIPELEARVKALLRRATRYNMSFHEGADQEEKQPKKLAIGHLELDLERQELRAHGKLVGLTAKEFDLLVLFMMNPGKPFNRQQLLDAVWGMDMISYEHAVSSHINRLRRKIEPKKSENIYIKTEWGVGYRFAAPSDFNDVDTRQASSL